MPHHCRTCALLVCLVTVVASFGDEILPTVASRAAWRHKFTPAQETLLDDIERGAFNFFWREVGSPACLAVDKTTDTISSIASVGFQLSALPIGVERGWITREQGEERALVVLRSLVNRADNKQFGIYLHYLDRDTAGLPDLAKYRIKYELLAGTVDHALFQAGVMTAGEYFGGEVAKLADQIVEAADYRAFERTDGFLSMGWRCKSRKGPTDGGEFIPAYWHRCSDEERLIYFLAAGAPRAEHAIPPEAYYRLERKIDQYENLPPHVVSWNGSLFTYFFSHCWIEYRPLGADDPAQFGIDAPRVDWFENTRRAALSQRARCIAAAKEFPTLGENRWGLAPCSFGKRYLVHDVRPNHSGFDNWCDGIVPPYGAASVLPMTPAESIAALEEYRNLNAADGSPLVWRDPNEGGYGFVDSFKLEPAEAPEQYLGIDQGPMLLAIENARTGLIWRLFMQHPTAQRAVQKLKLGSTGP